MRSGNRLNPVIYLQSFPLLFRHLSIVTAPLLAAVVAVLLDQLSALTTDAVGGVGSGIYSTIAQVIYLMAFGVATIQARDVWRGYKGTFDDAWSEAKSKMGIIAIGAIGFMFIVSFAGTLGSYLGFTILGAIVLAFLLRLVAVFLLIYTIPAAAIGGAPAGFAIQKSYKAAIAHPWATALLAIVYVVCTTLVPMWLSPLYADLSDMVVKLIGAAVNSLLLAYLAFPFARQYEDIA